MPKVLCPKCGSSSLKPLDEINKVVNRFAMIIVIPKAKSLCCPLCSHRAYDAPEVRSWELLARVQLLNYWVKKINADYPTYQEKARAIHMFAELTLHHFSRWIDYSNTLFDPEYGIIAKVLDGQEIEEFYKGDDFAMINSLVLHKSKMNLCEFTF